MLTVCIGSSSARFSVLNELNSCINTVMQLCQECAELAKSVIQTWQLDY